MKGIHFYSRPCGRGDLSASASSRRRSISTHAPAGGATPLRFFNFTATKRFLLTPLREGRRKRQSYRKPLKTFLLTPLREGRPLHALLQSGSALISTHAPAGGATSADRAYTQNHYHISTHAPAGGATIYLSLPTEHTLISTHAPAGGATYEAPAENSQLQFLLTPLREGRR